MALNNTTVPKRKRQHRRHKNKRREIFEDANNGSGIGLKEECDKR